MGCPCRDTDDRCRKSSPPGNSPRSVGQTAVGTLHEVLLSCGLKEIPSESAAYFLPGPANEVAGILGTHVDDILWAGNAAMDAAMDEVQKNFRFGKIEGKEFKFCGRTIKQTEHGIEVTSPNVMDRVKPIFIESARRARRAEPATDYEISQLRSVLGSVSWLARTCRPDLCYECNRLQTVQAKARIQDLIETNRLLDYAVKTRSRGIFYSANGPKLDDSMILSITDASHAASFTDLGEGRLGGNRSQSGRILALAPPDFLEKGTGTVALLGWTSTTIKRVCRSTMQADTAGRRRS